MTDTATKAGPLPVRTILLLPDAGTRVEILAPHAPVWIGAEPIIDEPAEFGTTVDPATPVVDDYDDSDDSDPRDRIKVSWPSLGVCGSVVAALYLVLARDGAVVPEGVMRAWYEADDVGYDESNGLSDALYGGIDVLVSAVSSWRRRGLPLGTLVLLDENGVEVSSG